MRWSSVRAAWRRTTAPAVAGVLALGLLAGCAGPGQLAAPWPAGLPVRAELAETPFFPDDSYYCGPAALATSLSAAGLPTRPEALVGQVFLPGREGALQVEMLAGARRRGAVATVIPPTPEALWREVAAGQPVVVLQNLGLSWAPSWHYAVVVGYDAEAATVLLRSGPMQRQEMALRTFLHTWDRSERWAFVTTPPGRLSATATRAEAVRALVAYERNAPAADAARAYRAGLARWPDDQVLGMGLGNALYAAGDPAGAERAFRDVAERHQSPAAYNNLARLLLERGDKAQARSAAERGLAVAGPLRATLAETLRAIDTPGSGPR